MSELILYQTDDGQAQLKLRAEDGSVWLSQLEIAELFATSVPNTNIHIRNILKEGELDGEAVIKESLITAADGKRYRTKLYRLEMILAVGYRVKGVRGTQFRQWATTYLAEYLVKGFVMDDERLKNPGGWDYFDELLARIREIRASEKRFYQKVRDLFALSADYQASDSQAQLFFAEVQNKLLYAVTQKTAAEIIIDRAKVDVPNMGLMTWSGNRVRKQDVIVVKNYLSTDEIDTLNRLVIIFLEQAELRAKQKQQLTLDYWRKNVDRLLEFNDYPVLQGAGSRTAEQAKAVASERYDLFDAERRHQDAVEADREDLLMLEEVEKEMKGRKGG
jgi:hypothetical protein